MKNFSFSIFNIICLLSLVLLIFLIILPFNLINMEQAQRIAKWKCVYENIKYNFDLVNLHEGSIKPLVGETEKIITEEDILNRIIPYFKNAKELQYITIPEYTYKYMNGTNVIKSCVFYFDKFMEINDGMLISINSNIECEHENLKADYLMFVDINGRKKPNRIGQDIFFINVYDHDIKPYGWNKVKELRADCSPIGSGKYCSEYYLLGGQF